MRDTLYIQLRDDAPEGRLTYAIVAGAPGAAVAPQLGTLDQILALAAGKRVVLFVPGADVRLAQVQVPARQAQRILQAAPYALEDQLAEDVDTLHFAIAADAERRRAGDPQPVAIVARARMDQWLAPLRAAGVKPDAMVPETLSLPVPEGGRWSGIADGRRVSVRTGPYAGFVCTLDDLGDTLQLADPEARTSLRLFVSRDSEFDFTRLNHPLELLPGYASALEILARHWRPDSSINLLQGAYSQKEDWQRLARPWRIAATVAVGWLVVALAAEAVLIVQTGRELRRQEQQNLARFQTLFPGETRIVNLAQQAEQQLAALRGGGARAPLFQLLDALAVSLAANPGLTLQTLQFREGALFLNLTGTDLAALENLRTWYASRRDTVLDVQAANAGTEGVQIRVKLSLS